MNSKLSFRIYIVSVCLLFSHVSMASGAAKCESLFSTASSSEVGAQFLHFKNKNLHNSREVNETALAHGLSVDSKPVSKLANWIESMDQNFKHAAKQGNAAERTALKEYYRNLFITKPENVTEGFFDLQKRIAREQGHGNIVLTNQMRNEMISNSLRDQAKSVDDWVDYFLSADSESYPMWTKYWALMGLSKMGQFNSETGTFEKRSKATMSIFPELNPEAFSLVVDAVVKKAGKEDLSDIQDPDFLAAVNTGQFSTMYGHAFKAAKANVIETTSVDGKWVVYPKGSDHMPLVNSLQGKNSGWCTAGEAMAKSQVQGGDFHVYYTKDKHDEYTTPRVAIRMRGNSVMEVRGVAKNQNLDGPIVSSGIVDKKLQEFGHEGQKYERKSEDMKKVTSIENMIAAGKDLTVADLHFLYEIDRKIEGFGQERDPRIEEILSKRDKREDLFVALEGKYNKNEIAITHEEALSGNAKYYLGDLDLGIFGGDHYTKLPEYVHGNVIIKHTKLVSGKLILPKVINGSLQLHKLESAKGVTFPIVVKGDMSLHSLRSAKGVKLPRIIEGNVIVYSLTPKDRISVNTQGLKGYVSYSNYDWYPQSSISYKINSYVRNLWKAIVPQQREAK